MSHWRSRIPCGKWMRQPCRITRVAGAVCILLATLLLLLCAPGWLIALIASGLLFMLGAWLLFGQNRGGPIR